MDDEGSVSSQSHAPPLYDAFISYSHAADGRLAPSLQSGLHRLGKKWYKIRALRVFRDQTNLSASPHLWGSIEQALSDSEWFLLLASPTAAASKWVRDEVAFWLAHRPAQKLLIVLTGGELVWNPSIHDFDPLLTTALPQNLFCVHRSEPRHVDLRWAQSSTDLSLTNPRFRSDVADLAASLHGVLKDTLIGEDVVQHRKFRRFVASVMIALLVLTIAAVSFGYQAQMARIDAESRRFAAQALLAAETDPTVALQLAITAGARANNPDTEAALRETLRGSHLESELTLGAADADLAGLPSEEQVVTVSVDGRVRMRDAGSSAPGIEQELTSVDTASRLPGVTVSRDGLLAVRYGFNVEVWNLLTQKQLYRFQTHDPVEHIGFSKDGTTLLTVSGASVSARLAANGTAIRTWNATVLVHADMSPGGHLVAAASTDAESVELFDARVEGPRLSTLPTSGRTSAVQFSPDGRWLTAVSAARGLKLWSVINPRTAAAIRPSVEAETEVTSFNCAIFHATQPYLLGCGDDGSARLWEIAEAEVRLLAVLRGHTAPVTTAAFSPVADTLATASEDGTIRLWVRDPGNQGDISPAWRSVSILRGHRGRVTKVAFTSDGKRLLSLASGAFLWDTLPDRELATVGPLDTEVSSVALDWKARNIFVKGVQRNALLAVSTEIDKSEGANANDSRVGPSIAPPPCSSAHDAELPKTDFTKTRTLEVDADSISVLDVRSCKSLVRIPVRDTILSEFSFSPDGHRIMSVGLFSNLHVWSDTGEHLVEIAKDRAAIAVFSSDSKRLVTAAGGVAYVWNTSDWQLVKTIAASDPSRIGTYLPSSHYVLFADSGGLLELVALEGRQHRLLLRGHTAHVQVARMVRAGTRLLTGDASGAIRLWDPSGNPDIQRQTLRAIAWRFGGKDPALAEIEPVVTIRDQQGTVMVDVSDDGQTFVTVGRDRMVRLYCADADCLMELARSRRASTARQPDRRPP